MTQNLEEQRRQLLAAVEEESYLSEEQRNKLRALIQLTDKVTVLDTVEDLLQRLLIQRTENYLLIVRKIQNAIRLEVRHSDQDQERRSQADEDQAVERLLQEI